MMIPKHLYDEIKAHEDEVITAYSDFNIVELPAGYDGEVNEAYVNLLKASITPSKENILIYLKAKANIMSILRKKGQKFLQSYSEDHPEERVGGIILPEWVIALEVVMGILVSGVTLIYILKKLFRKKFKEEEIQKFHSEIYNIKDVQTLIIIKQDKTNS